MDYILRPFTMDDVPSVVRYANNINIARYLTDGFPHPYTEADARRFIEKTLEQTPPGIFTIEINNEASGGIGLHAQEDIHKMNMELGYWLAEPYWGHGIVTRAVRQIVDYGFKTFDIDRIFARPFGNNPGSQRVLEKAGFTQEARFHQTIFKHGEYLDELIYAIRKEA